MPNELPTADEFFGAAPPPNTYDEAEIRRQGAAKRSEGVNEDGSIPGIVSLLDPSKAGENWTTIGVGQDGLNLTYVVPKHPGDDEQHKKDPDLYLRRLQQNPKQHYGAFETEQAGEEFMRSRAPRVVPQGQLPTAEEFFGEPTVQEAWTRQADQAIQRGAFKILDAFGYGVREGFGHEPIATPATVLSPETMETLRNAGIFNDYAKGQHNAVRTLYEGIFLPAAAAAALGQRVLGGIMGGPTAAVAQFGENLGIKPPQALTGEGGLMGALQDPGLLMLGGPEMSGFAAMANARRAANLDVDLSRARASGVIGEGEAGFHDVAPLTPENKAARERAAQEAGVATPPEPVVPPPKDVHELARRVDPEAFQKFDTLTAMKENIAAGLNELGATTEHPISLPVLNEPEVRLRSREAQIATDIADTQKQIFEAEKPSAEAFKAQESLSRLEAVEDQLKNPDLTPEARKELRTRRDEILTDTTPEALREQAAPVENLRTLRNQGASLARERDTVREELARVRAESLGTGEPLPLQLHEARRRLEELDDGIRELIPDIASAYRQAHEMMPEKLGTEASEIKPVEAKTPSEEITPQPAGAEPAMPPRVTGFKTAKGSTYKVNPSGTTTRDKADRADIGHEGQFGPQPESHRTFYVDDEGADKLSLFQAQGVGKMSIEARGNQAAVRFHEGENAGKVSRPSLTEISTEPKVGLTPVELWNDGSKVHFGNKITEVTTEEAPSVTAEPAKVASQRTTTALRPVQGTGETKVRGLAEHVEAKAIENALTEGFGELPEYQQVSMADQAERARNLIAEDYEGAKQVALGLKAPPRGVLPESVYVAVEKVATADGDVDLLRQLATESRLTTAATTMGQRIRTLGERDRASPTAAIQEVQAAREAAIAQRADLAAAKRATVGEIKRAVRASASTRQDWSDFITSITCAD